MKVTAFFIHLMILRWNSGKLLIIKFLLPILEHKLTSLDILLWLNPFYHSSSRFFTIKNYCEYVTIHSLFGTTKFKFISYLLLFLLYDEVLHFLIVNLSFRFIIQLSWTAKRWLQLISFQFNSLLTYFNSQILFEVSIIFFAFLLFIGIVNGFIFLVL